jgi:hypothetical protein
MRHILYFIFRLFRKLFRDSEYTKSFQEISGQNSNDYLFNILSKEHEDGLMICKFGSIEMKNILCYLIDRNHESNKIEYIFEALRGHIYLFEEEAMNYLCKNAGFFPNDTSLKNRYLERSLEDIKEIDILASYLKAEKYIFPFMKSSTKHIDLDGFYAPFLFKNPWSSQLYNKKVLVVHPFADSILKQYNNNRNSIFPNSDVLPQFKELKVIKAVQSIAGENTNFDDWFLALECMERQMDAIDYDVAIIGAGAYGMSLAAHAKRNKKIAIQLAGWTQMLFGIYGQRWVEDMPEFSKYINSFWMRPSSEETPINFKKVEQGCYW